MMATALDDVLGSNPPSPKKSKAPSLPPRRNSRYYNEMITFQVEDQLFRESTRYFSANSELFRTLFTLPSGDGKPEGQSDDNPLKLDGILAVDFERLLSIIYPMHLDPTEAPEHTIDEWRSVLKLSTMWGMAALRKHCIKKLSPLPSSMSITDKILFAREALAVDWLIEAYNELAKREETISEEEIQAIGLQAAIGILRAREEWLSTCEGRYYHPSDRAYYNFRDIIRRVFRSEICEMEGESI